MTLTLIVMAAGAAVALAVGWWLNRRPEPGPTGVAGEPPSSLARSDFRSPDAPLLLAVFTSATCSSCAAVWSEAQAFESSAVAIEDIEVSARPDLHERYRIESVPTTVLVDRSGEALHAFVGPVGPDDRRALADIVAANG